MADNLTISFTLPLPTMAVSLPGAIIADLPLLTISIDLRPGPSIDAQLPLLTSTISNLTGDIQTIGFTLGWPGLDKNLNTYIFGGVKEIRSSLPAMTFAGIYTSIPLIMPIAASLPKLVMASTATITPPDFTVAGTLPKLRCAIIVLSENIGSISATMQVPIISFHGITGSTGSISITLPSFFLTATLLTQGLVQINLTLPSFLFDSSGHSSSTGFINRSIVMNTKLFGVTEYQDVALAGLARAFGRTIALNGTDIITLGSNFDNTDYISAAFRTGTIDFSKPAYTRPKDIWITLRSGFRIRLTVRSDELPDEYEYESEEFITSLRKTRVKVGRGFYDMFYDFEIENINGEMIDVENIHILTEVISRRKR